MAVHGANLNNHPELPELRHRRMPQALTTTMQSGSMRYGGRDSRSNMKDGTGSPVAMPACTAPSRVKWRHLAATLVGIAATLVPGVGVADDVYLRAGIGFERPAETRFMDNDCSSVSPAALYGCGTAIAACRNGYPRRNRMALQRRCMASWDHRKEERGERLARYTNMRISAVSPLPTTSSAEYLGGLPRSQGLSPRFSIHFPISADLNSGQVVQKVGVSRQHGCTP